MIKRASQAKKWHHQSCILTNIYRAHTKCQALFCALEIEQQANMSLPSWSWYFRQKKRWESNECKCTVNTSNKKRKTAWKTRGERPALHHAEALLFKFLQRSGWNKTFLAPLGPCDPLTLVKNYPQLETYKLKVSFQLWVPMWHLHLNFSS